MENLTIFPGQNRKTPRSAGKKAAAVSICPELQCRDCSSPLAACMVLHVAVVGLLAEDQIVDVPVLPNTAPDIVGLVIFISSSLYEIGYKNTTAAYRKRWNKVFEFV